MPSSKDLIDLVIGDCLPKISDIIFVSGEPESGPCEFRFVGNHEFGGGSRHGGYRDKFVEKSRSTRKCCWYEWMIDYQFFSCTLKRSCVASKALTRSERR